jgi:2-methylcitrate dehydratase PrpD
MRAGAAFVNGTAAHGEDFDDTFEGGPVHAGAVIVPAVLAACERHNPDGRMALIGIAVGTESAVPAQPGGAEAVHKAGFHPTAVFGAMGAAAGVGARSASMPADCGRARHRRQHGRRHHRISRRGRLDQAAACRLGGAVGHSGGAAGAAGICRPAHVFEGVDGLFHGFAHTTHGDYEALTGDFGKAG